MEWDDIVYLSLLFISIGFGYFYRHIENPEQKKWIGTGVGFIMAVFVSGIHILHPIICVFINALIILFISKRICHIVSFVYTFAHLLFFRTTIYFGIPYPPAHTNLVQMMLTLKLVGLAFELNTAYNAKHTKQDGKVTLSDDKIEYLQKQPTFVDIWHYAFNYVGVLTGPYYKYSTFHDSMHSPFSKFVDCNSATIQKLKWVPLYAVLFLFLTSIWPISYAFGDEFYENRSWLYRLWYITPTFCWFRMRIYIGLTLSECVCTMAGLGAYPTFTETKPGEGPTKEFAKLKDLMNNKEEAKKYQYDFTTIYNINPYGSDFCTTFREGMKHWNICIQYWLAVNIYKRFPSKQLRTFATTFISALWHGVYIGYYFCITGVPFYLIVEDAYMKVVRKDMTGRKAVIWDWILYFSKMQGFAYLGFAFQLLSVQRVMRYYNSIYHSGEILLLILYLIVLYIKSQKRQKETKSS
ncbi:lysophospholipid acyltransferase 7 [Chrysoperla carnea]|uniref:lysophospholipid acyltransferase 7 n=1 Tax=Chrysoperla carnea TaxID=189513 RepID=UPI001D07B865|nr:lysophospholipid acyltransferase 7 [Chrysoperla carnea]